MRRRRIFSMLCLFTNVLLTFIRPNKRLLKWKDAEEKDVIVTYTCMQISSSERSYTDKLKNWLREPASTKMVKPTNSGAAFDAHIRYFQNNFIYLRTASYHSHIFFTFKRLKCQ